MGRLIEAVRCGSISWMSPNAEIPRERVVVGRVGRAHGVRGQVAIEVRTDEPELRFAKGAALLAGSPGDRIVWVDEARWHSGRLLVRFANIADRTAAAELTGSILEAEVDALDRPAAPDEYYDRHLIGLRAQLENGVELGTVREVLHLAGHDTLNVESADGSELLVPFVREIVPTVDLDSGLITVRPPAGLFGDSSTDASP